MHAVPENNPLLRLVIALEYAPLFLRDWRPGIHIQMLCMKKLLPRRAERLPVVKRDTSCRNIAEQPVSQSLSLQKFCADHTSLISAAILSL